MTDPDESAAPSGRTDIRQVTVKLSNQAYENLRANADERGLTMTGLIKKALAVDRFFYDHRDSKIVLDDGVQSREVVLLHEDA